MLIKQDLLSVVLDAQDFIRLDAEVAAADEMQGYLRGVFDLSKIFIEVLPWYAVQQYEAGAVVSNGTAKVGTGAAQVEVPLLYVANVATIGEEPKPAAPAAQPAPAPEPAPMPAEPAPGAEPPAPPAWVPKDPRAPLVKMYLIDMVLYHIHSRQNPRAIPQIRQDRYDTALQWCKDCRTGKVSPGLPLLPATAADGTPNQESIRVRGGSQPKLRNTY
jgi:hypothetical protein